jgi:chromosomal replication initiator protein
MSKSEFMKHLSENIGSPVRVPAAADADRLNQLRGLLAQAREIIGQLSPLVSADEFDPQALKATAGGICNFVAAYYNFNRQQLENRDRHMELVWARHVACFFLNEMTTLRQREIGQCFGGRNHSMVVYAIRHVNDVISTNPKKAAQIEFLRRKLKEAFK